MGSNIEALKRIFREGRHAEAVWQCEAALAREPADRELQRLCANDFKNQSSFPAERKVLRIPVAQPGRCSTASTSRLRCKQTRQCG
ncbi:hypothetical protein WG902_08585 [Ramlibacter sp. PS3R-8]|uniref:hypothetical protein n=1 Tax=Ramlibacter sp. PS3R-8 TaxID=3133437 RepID=UPI0030A2C886